jgi:hypothetical protein
MFGVGGGRLGRRVGMGGVLIPRRGFCEQLGKKNPFDGCATMNIHDTLPSGQQCRFQGDEKALFPWVQRDLHPLGPPSFRLYTVLTSLAAV